MIRPEFHSRITQALEETGDFFAVDFKLNEEVKSNETILVIKYRHQENYFFSASISNDKRRIKSEYGESSDYSVAIRMSPGGMTTLENKTVVGRATLLSEIKSWTQLVYEDLGSTAYRRQFDRQQEEIEKLADSLGEIEDSYFSQSEADELKARLDALEQSMKEGLRESVRDKTKLDAQVSQLEKDMVDLKMQVDVLKKPSWKNVLVIRVLRWIKDPSNQKLLKSGAETVANLLTDGKPPL